MQMHLEVEFAATVAKASTPSRPLATSAVLGSDDDSRMQVGGTLSESA